MAMTTIRNDKHCDGKITRKHIDAGIQKSLSLNLN